MSVKYLKVENEKSLVRDTATKAILNTDISAVKKHELKMEQVRQEKAKQEEINSLKRDIAEIKYLLSKLVDK